MAIYRSDTDSMSFLQNGVNPRDIDAMTVSNDFKLVAICETRATDPTLPPHSTVSIFHSNLKKQLRTMGLQDVPEFISCAFGGENKYLVTIGGEIAPVIAIWRWESQKLISRVASPNPMTRVRMHWKDHTILTTSGPNHLKVWRMAPDFSLRPTSLVTGKKEHENFVDHLWLPSEEIVAVSEPGMISILQLGETPQAELLQNIEVKSTAVSVIPSDSPGDPAAAKKLPIRGGIKVATMAVFSRGFIIVGEKGLCAVYERNQGRKNDFVLVKVLFAGQEVSRGGLARVTLLQHDLSCIAVSPGSSTAALFSRSSPDCILTLPLKELDLMAESDASVFKPLPASVSHRGSIIGMATAVCRPLLCTAGSDRTIRLFNYLDMKVELVEKVQDEPTCIDMHPTGFFMLVGYRDRLHYYSVTMTELRVYKELPVKNCRQVAFCHGGHMFAVAAGISVMVYHGYSFTPLMTLTGHVGMVKQLTWSLDDTMLFSSGADGGVYGWSLEDRQRLDDASFVQKGVTFTGVVVESMDGWRMTLAGTDGMLSVISGGHVETSISAVNDTTGAHATQLLLGRETGTLCCSSSDGWIRLFKNPPRSSTALLQEFAVGDVAITDMCFAAQEDFLFAGTADGSLLFFRVHSPGVSSEYVATQSSTKQLAFNNVVVMMVRETVEDHIASIAELEKKLVEAQDAPNYELRLRDSEWAEEARRQKERLENQLSAERERCDGLQAKLEQQLRQSREEAEKVEASHVRMTQELESQFEHRLAVELARYDSLSEDTEALRQKCEEMLEQVEDQHRKEVGAIKSAQDKERKQLQTTIQKLENDIRFTQARHEEALVQQTNEQDLVIAQMKQATKTEILAERQTAALKAGQLTAQKNRCEALQKKVSELKQIAEDRREEKEAVTRQNGQLETALRQVEMHLQEREVTLAKKERLILKLRARSRTLDNFRYVLDNKIQELIRDQGPMKDQLDGLRAHVKSMYDELVLEFAEKKSTRRALGNKEMKIEGLMTETSRLRDLLRDKERLITGVFRDLTDLVHTDVKDLPDSVKDLYRHYVRKEEKRLVRTAEEEDGEGGNVESVAELERQRNYQQRCATTMKKAVTSMHRRLEHTSKNKMKENALLVSECNQLRKKNSQLFLRLQEVEQKLRLRERLASLGAKRAAPASPISVSSRSEHQQSQELFGQQSVPSLPSGRPTPFQLLESTRGMKKKGGHVVRGSNRDTDSSTKTQAQISMLLRTMDESNRELGMQRGEIKRLRDQIQFLEGRLHTAGIPHPFTAPLKTTGGLVVDTLESPSGLFAADSAFGGRPTGVVLRGGSAAPLVLTPAVDNARSRGSGPKRARTAEPPVRRLDSRLQGWSGAGPLISGLEDGEEGALVIGGSPLSKTAGEGAFRYPSLPQSIVQKMR